MVVFDSEDSDFPCKCGVCGHEWHSKIADLRPGSMRCPATDCRATNAIPAFETLLPDARKDPRLFYSQFARLRPANG